MNFRLWVGGIVLLSLMAGLLGCSGLRPNPKYREEERPRSTAVRTTPSEFTHRLTQQIEAYLGVPYKWGGTTRQGMDCSGFVSVVYENAVGLRLPRKAREMYNQGRLVEKHDLRFGDLVFFERIENYGVSHVGIYIGDNEFAHASTSRGVVISNLTERYYRERYVGARRVYRP